MSGGLDQTQPLSNFETLQPYEIFKSTTSFPDFFKTHLVDPLRVIKVFKDDPNGLERIFYYQYLKLCVEDEGYPDIRIENMKIILNSPEFYFIFPSDCQTHPYTDNQFKRLGIQFLDLLKSHRKRIDDALERYPIVDQVFTYLMRSLLILNMQAEQSQQFIGKEQLLQVLGRVFDIEYANYDKCTKFEESDIFVYEESPFEIYMVYLRQPQVQPIIHLAPHLVKQSSSKKQRNELYKSNTSNNEHYDFVDYTQLEKHRQILLKANLFQSENLSMKSYSQLGNNTSYKNEFNLFETFNQHGNKPQPKINVIEAKIEENIKQAEEEVVMDIDELIKDLNNLNNKNNNNVSSGLEIEVLPAQRKKQAEPENELSGFQSEQDAPKFKTNFPTTSTFSKLVQPKTQAKAAIKSSPEDQEELNSLTSLTQNIESAEQTKTKEKEQDQKNESVQPCNYGANLDDKEAFLKLQQGQISKDNESDTNLPFFEQYRVKKTIPSYLQHNFFGIKNSEMKHAFNPIVRLNVTKQFTNSFILKQMPEIYQENIRRARDRARAFRKKVMQVR